MAEVIGVRFKEVGKIYYFDPKNIKLKTGDKVIVETARGIECGMVALANKEVPDDELVFPSSPSSERLLKTTFSTLRKTKNVSRKRSKPVKRK